MSSSPSATAPAKAAMARTVTRIARAKASWPSVASRPLRWGSSEVWIDWKSCSGARVMSSALKTTPARAVVAVALTVSTDALSSACSASWIAATESGEAGARAQRERALVGDGRRVGRRSGGRSPTARRAARPAAPRGCPARRPTARWRGRPRPRPGSRSATPTRRARGRRRARTTGGRPGSRGRSSWRRRRASRRRRSSTAWSSRRRPRSGPRSASATTRKAAAKPACTSSAIRSGCRP